ncbi:MAG TPA: M48 family metalloprotease [Candidatus Sulfotelmatobacter sp.]|nr:M48 family metalloprotease [Candidatus Sulfotelmatobacter sp.]
MRGLKILPAALALGAMQAAATAQQLTSLSEVEDKIFAQEQAEVQLLRQYSPLVETYIQYLRPDKELEVGEVPEGDKYFIGRADLAKGVELEPLERSVSLKHKLREDLREFFSSEFVPSGFLQMIYLDMNGFDRQHYKIEYIQRAFLGEVRCLVFDVDPLPRSGKGRFVGRIWVEDHDYHIVRFNGAYGGSSLTSNYFNFDSWRTNVGKNLWLPAFIYAQEGSSRDPKTRKLAFKPFRSQTRLWGYGLGHARQEQELTKVLVEPSPGIRDQKEAATDYSPLESERSWERQTEDNVNGLLERKGLLAPYGEVDKVLETVINNIEVTNNLNIQPEVRCRILMTSTLESFTMGHTIVLSRGLVDVLPDEGTLAAILAHELGHVVLGHRMDTQFAFFDTLQFGEKQTFRHFDFGHTVKEERASNQKAIELLRNSPYVNHQGTAQLFFLALKNRSKNLSNLISPNLGDRVPTSWTIGSVAPSKDSKEKPAANVVAALPLGGRIKIDPWNDQLRMLNSKPTGAVAESEKMPFQIAPIQFYLTRQEVNSPETPDAAAKLVSGATKP